ncbi:MAG: cytochrome d ubiquinol oxidase subunit II [Victivallales bacterium]
MDALAFWQISAFACLIFMMFMYSILDGFDLGLGVLIGFVTENDEEKRTLLGYISPFWDGNEVWLVIAVSTLFAAFPQAYSNLLPSFYLPFLFIIILFMCRAISLEFAYSGKDISRTSLWIFSITSFLASSLGILFLGVMISGIPTGKDGVFMFSAMDIIRPLPLIFASAWILLMLLHSISYMTRKSDGALRDRLMKLAKRMFPAFTVLYLTGIFLLYLRMPQIAGRPVVLAGAFMTIAGALAFRSAIGSKVERHMFAFSTLAMGGVWVVMAGSMFPNIANPVQNGNGIMTIYDSSAPLNTLRVIVLSALFGMASLIVYVFSVYAIFRRKAVEDKTGVPL